VSTSQLDAWLEARTGAEGEARGRRLGATADGDKPWRGTQATSSPDAPKERRQTSPSASLLPAPRTADGTRVRVWEGAALVAEPLAGRARPTGSPAERGGGSGGGSTRAAGAEAKVHEGGAAASASGAEAVKALGVRPLVLVGIEVESPKVAEPPRRRGGTP